MFFFSISRPLESTVENVRRLVSREIELPYCDQCPTDKTTHTQCSNCGVSDI